jgi:hypothetical protein
MSENPALFYVGISTTGLCIFATAFVVSPKLRIDLGDLIMTFVRSFAFAVGWMCVALLYLPIQVLNFVKPYEVPYLRHLRAKETNKRAEACLPVHKDNGASRYAPVFENDDE